MRGFTVVLGVEEKALLYPGSGGRGSANHRAPPLHTHTPPVSFCIFVKHSKVLLENRFFWLLSLKMDVPLG